MSIGYTDLYEIHILTYKLIHTCLYQITHYLSTFNKIRYKYKLSDAVNTYIHIYIYIFVTKGRNGFKWLKNIWEGGIRWVEKRVMYGW